MIKSFREEQDGLLSCVINVRGISFQIQDRIVMLFLWGLRAFLFQSE